MVGALCLGTWQVWSTEQLDTTFRGGLVVRVGIADVDSIAALRVNDAFLVQGLDTDAEKVRTARQRIQSLGVYGPVSVDVFDGKHLPYVDNLVNLVVADDLGGVQMDEVMRVLTPNGVAIVAGKRTVKPRPPEIDEWTHYMHGPDGNAVAKDRVVASPQRLQWQAGPRWGNSHENMSSFQAMVTAGGRVFAVLDEAPSGFTDRAISRRWMLVCRDAFNGVRLWSLSIPKWGEQGWGSSRHRDSVPAQITRRLVADAHHVYFTLGWNAPVSKFDAATGRLIHTFDAAGVADEILLSKGLLLVATRRTKHDSVRSLVALDAEDGSVRWRVDNLPGLPYSSSKVAAKYHAVHLLPAVGSDFVCVLADRHVVCLALDDGRERWRFKASIWPANENTKGNGIYSFHGANKLVVSGQTVLLAQRQRKGKSGIIHSLTAIDATRGKSLWTTPCGGAHFRDPTDLFVVDDLVWTYGPEEVELVGYDLRTGKAVKRFSTHGSFNHGHHHRCYQNKATERFILTAGHGVEFNDLSTGTWKINDWIRGQCRYGIMPANGLLYVPPHFCRCYGDIMITGFLALAGPEQNPSRTAEETEDLAPMLEIGPARKSERTKTTPEKGAWPMHRANITRSAHTPVNVGSEWSLVWEQKLGGQLTACTRMGERICVADRATHRVWGLDAATGVPRWHFTAGGAVNSAPTFHSGRVLFGAVDGWLYCLDASDGRLAWRRQMAPHDRRVVIEERVESVWPCDGSVLVMEDVVYAAAGRSSYLDGGLRVMACRIADGEMVGVLEPIRQEVEGHASKHKKLKGNALTRFEEYGDEQLCGRRDLLASDGVDVFMGLVRFRVAGVDASKPRLPLRALSYSGMLDDTRFQRAGWRAVRNDGLQACRPGGEIMAFDAQREFWAGRSTMGSHKPKPAQPGDFVIVALPRPDVPTTRNASTKKTARRKGPPVLWEMKVPVWGNAMVATADKLIVAGQPDEVDKTDPWAAYEGRTGGRMLLLDSASGKLLSTITLPSPPVYDGLSLGGGQILVATVDGRVLCLGQSTR